ncbi:hypothetical protein C8R46DRAFT_1187345 [Mycena filopes]|nr:hypothetical protein C8R46DRAFT_1187345 [Mycena filopes]
MVAVKLYLYAVKSAVETIHTWEKKLACTKFGSIFPPLVVGFDAPALAWLDSAASHIAGAQRASSGSARLSGDTSLGGRAAKAGIWTCSIGGGQRGSAAWVTKAGEQGSASLNVQNSPRGAEDALELQKRCAKALFDTLALRADQLTALQWGDPLRACCATCSSMRRRVGGSLRCSPASQAGEFDVAGGGEPTESLVRGA